MKRHIEEFPRVELFKRYDFVIAQVKLKTGKTRLVLRVEQPWGNDLYYGHEILTSDLEYSKQVTKVTIHASGWLRHHTIHNKLEIKVCSRKEERFCKLLLGRLFQAIPMTFDDIRYR